MAGSVILSCGLGQFARTPAVAEVDDVVGKDVLGKVRVGGNTSVGDSGELKDGGVNDLEGDPITARNPMDKASKKDAMIINGINDGEGFICGISRGDEITNFADDGIGH